MFPSFELIGRTIFAYPLMAATGALAAGVLVCRVAAPCGKQRQDDMIVLLLLSAIGAFIGGHLLYAAVSLPAVVSAMSSVSSFRDFVAKLQYAFGGSIFYGGLAGGIAAGALYLRGTGRGFQEYSDMATPSIPLFHAFGRLGCFLGGCCYGTVSSVGFVFRRALVESANNVRRLPVQLIESAFLFLLCAILYRIYKTGAARGRLIYIYLCSYGIFRFIIEFWRGDEYRGVYFGLSTSQWISVFVLIFCAIKLFGYYILMRMSFSR
jgi:phosphatidylglycerol:prolipoprotein diacylglycerol transferase